jgi:PKD repeat protein
MSVFSRIRNRKRSRGQSVVEFALIAPVLIFLLLITLDFGRLFMSYITLTNTTRVAANYGALSPGSFTGVPNTATYDAVVARESAGLNCELQADAGGHNPPIPTFQANGLGKTTGLGAMSVASMTCNFSLLTPFITNFFGGPLPISASAEFPIHTGAIANIGGTIVIPPPGSPLADFDFTGVSGGTIDGAGNVTGVGTVTVNVNDKSLNAQTWIWDWDDGSPTEATATPAAHTYTVPNVYTVRLTVTNPIGTSVRTRAVTVTAVPVPVPVAGFYGDPVAGAPKYTAGGGSTGVPISGSLPLVVQFTNQSTNGTTFSWSFGDGTPPSTAPGPQHSYSNLGVFSVTLTVTLPTGGTPITRTDYITTGCVVPNFFNRPTNLAQGDWTAAGLSGSITYHAVGAPGNGKKNPPNPPKNIVSQSPLTGGAFVAATKKNAGSPWICDGDITLEYTP